MSEFRLSNEQATLLELLVRLIGLSGVHKRPEHDDAIVLDLLPAEHTIGGGAFCIRVQPDGRVEFISDDEAGIAERPDALTAMRARVDELLR